MQSFTFKPDNEEILVVFQWFLHLHGLDTFGENSWENTEENYQVMGVGLFQLCVPESNFPLKCNV